MQPSARCLTCIGGILKAIIHGVSTVKSMRYNENMLIADGFFKENFLEMMKVVRL
jgi:hypothetical protein